ncbi:Hydrogenase expression protein HypF OS=Streptomyces alboniger OX=132473 GN=CP975_24805 PE=4 SV=1 [Streptomyces alboniger]
MPADEVHHESSAGEPRARTGPRHAAPRKPLLTRLQVPAGKAIAIAAMPTAVLMGMGLTPTLAQARPGVPDNPFQDGPCVTAPDKDAEDEAAQDADKAKEEAAEKAARDAARKDAEKEASDPGEDERDPAGQDDGARDDEARGEKPSATPSPSAGGGTDAGDGDGDGDEPAAKPPADEPEPAETKNPWDPLGLGDALKDAFTPDEDKDKDEDNGEEKAEEPQSPAPTTSGSEDSEDSENPGGSGRTGSSEDPVKDSTDEATGSVEDTVDKLEDGVEKGADGAADEAGEAEDAAKDAAGDKEGAGAEDPMAPDENGKKPFPCVVEKKVDGEGEQTPVPIPNQPWHLEASSLTLKGADYQGVVNLTMPDGRTKQALKYVVQNTDIGDLHQIVEGPAGKKYHVEAAKGSTSTIRGGETTMYTERISGKLFGLIPITFDPEHPPPINIPLIHFTDVKVQQAGQFGGNLTIPGLHQSISD